MVSTSENSDAAAPVRRVCLCLARSVLFPRDVITVELGEPENQRALARINVLDGLCVAVPLQDPDEERALAPERLVGLGTLARVVDRSRLAGGSLRLVLQGIRRVRLAAVEPGEGALWAECKRIEHAGPEPEPGFVLAQIERFRAGIEALAAADESISRELSGMIGLYGHDLERITDLASAVLPLTYTERAALLCEPRPEVRLETLTYRLEMALVRARAGRSLEDKVAQRIRKNYLREKLATLRSELGESSPQELEVARLKKRIDTTPLSPAARRSALRELENLRRSAPTSPAVSRIRGHLEWMLELAWPSASDRTRKQLYDFEKVERLLSKSHFGLTDVKRRIGEFLAVRSLGGGARGTVLCFLGPPGTGKSSMARAVARALGRPFVSIPFGTVTHEREIVGVPHERQGGTPGLILAGIHRTGASNPVILLDEIDKVSLGGEGTSAGALLQLLDTEQNDEFLDLYLGVPFDLSNCLFLATANDSDRIPQALADRVETIDFNGYSDSEKYKIGRFHLLPRALEYAGLRRNQFHITPGAMRTIVQSYTEEAGVRQLQRHLVALARKAAVQTVRSGPALRVTKTDLVDLLGPRTVEEELRLQRPAIGVATGLAWTAAGGSLLPIEAVSMPGSGRLTLTGQLGDVLRESVQTAVSYVRTYCNRLGLDPELLDSTDVHVHFPSAATPKDGPSAGVAIATALVSLLMLRPARHDIAMTGEMSLLGQVLAVGGIREKLLAAIRSGIPEIVLPARNGEECLRLDPDIRNKLRIHLIDDVREAFDLALLARSQLGRKGVSSGADRKRAAKQARSDDARHR